MKQPANTMTADQALVIIDVAISKAVGMNHEERKAVAVAYEILGALVQQVNEQNQAKKEATPSGLKKVN